MKEAWFAFVFAALALSARADSNINSTNACAWGANVGWIQMGNGTPANNIYYSNGAGADFGVNYLTESASPGMARLRGYAYGANIGWINFEGTGNPRLRFSDGRLEGYAYSANCGGIVLVRRRHFCRAGGLDCSGRRQR